VAVSVILGLLAAFYSSPYLRHMRALNWCYGVHIPLLRLLDNIISVSLALKHSTTSPGDLKITVSCFKRGVCPLELHDAGGGIPSVPRQLVRDNSRKGGGKCTFRKIRKAPNSA